MRRRVSQQRSKLMVWRFLCPLAGAAISVCGCQDDGSHRNPNASDSQQTQTQKPALAVEIESLDPPPMAIVDEPVQASMRLSEMTEDSFQLFIDVRIAPGWHIYAADGESGPFAPTVLELQLPTGVEMAGKWKYPEMQPRIESGTLADVYEGNVSFRADLKLRKSFPETNQTIQCRLEYQACNQFRCLPTTTRDLKFSLNQQTPDTPEN